MAPPFVDHIEGAEAIVVIDGVEKRLPLNRLPKGLREGVFLTENLDSVDEVATDLARDEIAELRRRLKKDDGGDFSL